MAQNVAYFTGFETGDLSETALVGIGISAQSSIVRTGGYTAKITAGGSSTVLKNGLAQQLVSIRFYWMYETLPLGGASTIYIVEDGNTPTTDAISIKLETTGLLTIIETPGTGNWGIANTSGVTVPTANTWHLIEWTLDAQANGIVKVWLDGKPEINTIHTTAAVGNVTDVRIKNAANTGSYYFDDIRLDIGGLAKIGPGRHIARQGKIGTPISDNWTKNKYANSYLNWSNTPFDANSNCSSSSSQANQTSLIDTFNTVPNTQIKLFLTSGSSWTVPGDWSNTNIIECIGGGGAGSNSSVATGSGEAGGGAAYASITNLQLGIGSSITYNIGLGAVANTGPGGNTWFNGANLWVSSVGAVGGDSGVNPLITSGGRAASCVGTVKFNGGRGGTSSSPGGGGGGAAGTFGNGANGANGGAYHVGIYGGSGGGGNSLGTDGATPVANTGGTGGNNNAGTGGGTGVAGAAGNPGTKGGGGAGGAGGATSTNAFSGGAGGNGIDSDPANGSGGGGGGSAGAGNDVPGTTAQGGQGGLYGGGGGGAGYNNATGGSGGQGVIIITYTSTKSIPGIGPADTINACKTAIIGKSGVSNKPFIIRRLNGANTLTSVTVTTADAYYDDGIWTDTLTNLNSMEAGVGKPSDANLNTVEDLWVMVDFTPANYGRFFDLFI